MAPEKAKIREPHNSLTPVPSFHKGAGFFLSSCGTYSHSGMMDYPGFPISEMHLGKFPEALEFQSWEVNFKK